MTNAVVKKEESFSLTPKSLAEAMQYAEMMAKSSIVPKDFQGKPGDIMVAVQMGAELGLKPIQSIQNIAVINGRPSVWGDAALALVKSSPLCDDIIETFDPIKMEATCVAKRKGKTDVVQSFNKQKAVTAGLWEKVGPWKNYPERMIQMRARGFALRDQFTDVLKGLILAEEAQDMPMENVTPATSNTEELLNMISGNKTTKEIIEPEIEITQPEIVYPLVLELETLIREKAVPQKTVDYWLESAKVNTLAELDDIKLKKCVDYVQEKFK